MTTARTVPPAARPPYQVMSDLSVDERVALEASIREHGVLVPVEVDAETGQILDGHHRAAIAESLGIGYPRVIRSGLTEDEKVDRALALNLARRHLTGEARAAVVAGLRARGWSTRKISRTSGVSQSTVIRAIRKVESGDSPAVVVGTDGKRYAARRARPSITVHSDTGQRRAQDALQYLAESAPAKPLTLSRAERLVRDGRSAARRVGPAVTLPSTIRIEHADFRDLDIEPGTVDLVLTDPPYRAEDFRSGLWTDLAAFAAQVLKPGGLLLTYTGQMHLPHAITALGQHLDYWWLWAVVHDRGSGTGQVRQRNLGTAWKPVLAYRAPGGDTLPPWSVDVIRGAGRAKTTGHPWEQGVHEAEALIRTLTLPGATVLDPFLGSGTTAVAAARLGRQVIGCDINAAHVRTARQRVADTLTPGEQGSGGEG